jgi:hypothetical protein
MMRRVLLSLTLLALAGTAAGVSSAEPVFVNGLALDGAMLGRSGGFR